MGCAQQNSAPIVEVAAPKCPDQISNFFKTMVPIAANLADKWNSSTNDILALSAYESGWLGQHAQSLHNPFGLTRAGGNDLNFRSYQAAADFWSNNDGAYIQGKKNIDDFADAIQPHYNTKNPDWKSTLESVYQSVLNGGPFAISENLCHFCRVRLFCHNTLGTTICFAFEFRYRRNGKIRKLQVRFLNRHSKWR